MYTDDDVERIYLGLPFVEPEKVRPIRKATETSIMTDCSFYTLEEVNRLFLGLPLMVA